MAAQNYKIVLVGDAEAVKNTFVHLHLNGELAKKYNSTIDVKVHPIRLSTNYGDICFNMWDCVEDYSDLREDFYLGADAAMVFLDIPRQGNVATWVGKVRSVVPKAPVAIYANKCDLVDYLTLDESPSHKVVCQYDDIPSKNNDKRPLVLLALARLLTGHDDLYFVDHEADYIPEEEGKEEGEREKEDEREKER